MSRRAEREGCRLLTGGLLLVCASSGLRAQAPGSAVLAEEPNWAAVCKAAIAEPLPAEAAQLAEAAANTANAPRQCDEESAYYGFDQAPNYSEALRCAYLQRDKPENEVGSLMHGPGTLAMLYANGDGVPRDYGLAIRFACEIGDSAAQAETSLRVGRLEALRDGKRVSTKPFDLCDDATSGAMGAYCQEIADKQADVGRRRRLKDLQARLPEPAQVQLPRLEAAEIAFETARGKGEYTGGGGSGSAGFRLLDQGELREQFVINLRRFAAGDLPKAISADRARVEQQLKAAAALAREFKPDPNALSMEPTPQSLAAAQQAWETLFAAWMRFVPVAYPHLSPDAAATELLRLRLHQIRRVEQGRS